MSMRRVVSSKEREARDILDLFGGEVLLRG
jgi:hypothetical protein